MNLDISGSVSGIDNIGSDGFAIKSGLANAGAWEDGGADDTIYLRSTASITGDIDLTGGDDTVITEIGPTTGLNGILDLGGGADHLTYGGGTWKQNDPYALNFEDYEVDATAELTLDDNWDIGTKTARVSGGSLYIPDTLDGGGLTVDSGSANISGTASFSGASTIDGSLDVSGTMSTDTLDINGSADVTGVVNATTTDLSGTMSLNGTLNSDDTNISSSGFLSGTGTINGNVTNNGSISPGNSIGTLTVNGDVTFNSGSTYEVEISGNASDKITVNGAVQINGGTVKTSIPRKLYTGKERWTIISATDGVNGRFDGLSGAPSSATLHFGLGYSATTVGIYVTRTPYESFGATKNDQAVGGALDTILPGAVASGTDMEQFLIELDFDYTADQISEALAALNPEVYSSFVDMEFITSQEFARDIATRMNQLRESKLHLDAKTNLQGVQNIAEESNGKVEQIRPGRGWNLWAQTSGSVTENGATDTSGYDIRSARVTVGGDNQLYDWLLIGAAMGLNQSDLDYNLGNQSGDQTGMHVALYGDVNYSGFYLNSILGYGNFNNDSERVMDVFGTTAEASFDGTSLSAQVGTGYDFSFSNWQVGPAVEVGVARIDVDSFTETGNRTATTLTIDDQTDNHTYGRFGIKAASVYQVGTTTLLPRVGIGYQRTSSDDPYVDAYFSGYQDAMFTVTGAESPESTFGGELGLTALVGNQLSLYGKFNSAFGDDYSSYGLSLGLDWRF